jgi:glycosyltransferase involved in cell wall biosynthesis
MLPLALTIAGLGLGCLLVGLYPFGPYQLSLLVARRLRPAPPVPQPHPAAAPETFAICLCAYNEERTIEAKIEDLLQLRKAAGQLEILVYVDAAADRTAALLEPYRDRITLVVSPERRGKTHGMNLLVGMTRASVLMFTDANVRIEPDAVAVLRRYFADPSVGCVCSHLTYVNDDAGATATVGSAYWRLNEWTRGLETDTGSAIGGDGSLFAMRRALHVPVPLGLFDDLFLPLTVLSKGHRVVRAPELRAFEWHTTSPADEFKRKIRIACECMAVHAVLWPRLRTLDWWHLYKYVMYRLLRWIGGWFLATACVLLTIAAGLLVGVLPTLALLLLAGGGLWLGLRWRIGPVEQLWNMLLAFAGNAIGAWRALRGERAVTWNVAASARPESAAARTADARAADARATG